MGVLYVYNDRLEMIALVENFSSFIWTDRYRECGDFEITCVPTTEALNAYKKGYYVMQPASPHVMVIETITINTDAEEGSKMTVSGRSAESILDRRVVWDQTILEGSLDEGVHTLLDISMLNPTNTKRKVDGFLFQASASSDVSSLELNAQYHGETLYDIVTDVCATYGIGFQVLLNSQKQFVFSLYSGTNRSYSQNRVPYVIFSPTFENLLDSRYSESNQDYKNTALVGGEGEGTDRTMTSIYWTSDNNEPTGLARREMFVNSSTRSTNTETGDLTPEEYEEELKWDGLMALSERTEQTIFDGSISTRQLYVPYRDFFLGDIVQLANEFGHSGYARIVEIISCWDQDGYSLYPTFEMVTL